MHDGSYGRKYCGKSDCHCKKFVQKEFSDTFEFPVKQINPNIDNTLILVVDAFIGMLCELGYGYIPNGTTGGAVLSNIYNAILEEPNNFIHAKTPREIVEYEKE
jgi:hypothetical protein